jgi:hypothetical protein
MNPTLVERPSVLELSGAELLIELPRLKAAGATVFGMAAICNGRWRLTLHWPAPEQQSLLPDGEPLSRYR